MLYHISDVARDSIRRFYLHLFPGWPSHARVLIGGGDREGRRIFIAWRAKNTDEPFHRLLLLPKPPPQRKTLKKGKGREKEHSWCQQVAKLATLRAEQILYVSDPHLNLTEDNCFRSCRTGNLVSEL